MKAKNSNWIIKCYAIIGISFIILTTSCDKVDVSTSVDLNSITQTSAICECVITSKTKTNITTKGVCWSTEIEPTTNDNYTYEGEGVGSFTSVLKNLKPDTKYYVRAYAMYGNDKSYGNIISFTTQKIETGSLADID